MISPLKFPIVFILCCLEWPVKSDWGLLAQLSICRWDVDEWLNFTCTFVDSVCVWLCACLPARRLNGCFSAYCWVRGLILLHPHHGLVLTHPWNIPEASSLIDSSVPFLPRPRSAESGYCPTTRCTHASKQPCSHSWALYMQSIYKWILGNL